MYLFLDAVSAHQDKVLMESGVLGGKPEECDSIVHLSPPSLLILTPVTELPTLNK